MFRPLVNQKFNKIIMDSVDLFELYIRCDVTNVCSKLYGPYCFDIISEENEMYERHAVPKTTLLISQRNTKLHPLDWFEKICACDKQHNSFNTKFKPPQTHTIIPKDPNDPRDVPWLLTFDSLAQEKDWIESGLDTASEKIYKNNTHIQPSPTMVESLWHRGYVNILFDRTHCSYFSTVRDWIRQIGNTYNPTVISNLKGVCGGSGLYRGEFFTNDVKHLCEYCHKIFAIDRYETAKLFTTKDPQDFDIPACGDETKISTRAYRLTQVAAVYAERGCIDSAREYYQKAIETLNGKDWQCNFIKQFKDFEKYVEQHGTSILSSHF